MKSLFFRSTRGHAPRWNPDSSTSEVTTIQLEFRDLSRCLGDPRYEEAADRVSRIIHAQPREDGLVPIFINANSGDNNFFFNDRADGRILSRCLVGKFRKQATITLGARGDSYYEYLLKQWLQTGKTRDEFRADFVDGIIGVSAERGKHERSNPTNRATPTDTPLAEISDGVKIWVALQYISCSKGSFFSVFNTCSGVRTSITKCTLAILVGKYSSSSTFTLRSYLFHSSGSEKTRSPYSAKQPAVPRRDPLWRKGL